MEEKKTPKIKRYIVRNRDMSSKDTSHDYYESVELTWLNKLRT